MNLDSLFALFFGECWRFESDQIKSVSKEVLDYKIVCEGQKFAPYVQFGSNWYRICGAHNVVVDPSMLAEGLYFKCDSYEAASRVIENHKHQRILSRMPDTEIYNSRSEPG